MPKNDLFRLAKDLQRARGRFIEATRALSPSALETVVEESGWTVRRLIEYCRAQERWHFTRMFHFFDEDVKVYDSLAALMDHEAPASTDLTLARECSEIWLAGRETEMWVDILLEEDIDSIRVPSAEMPAAGWNIRGVFERVTRLYREKTKVLSGLARKPDE